VEAKPSARRRGERERGEFWRRERDDGTLGKKWWTNLFGRRVSTGFERKSDAEAWKRARLREGADPRRAAAEKAHLDDAMRALYAELRRRGRSPATQKRARQKLAHFPRLWGAKCKLATVDLVKIQKYVDTRLSDSLDTTGFQTPKRITIRDELAFLRQMLKLARRQGLYHMAIDDVLDRFETGHKPKKDWCTPESLEKLLERVTDGHKAHLLFFLVTAGRLADSYRAERVDFALKGAQPKAHVRGSKTDGSFRTIPIEPIFVPYAERMLRLAEGDGKLLFLPWPNLHRSLREACERAGIPPVTTNGLRRTFGKWLRLAGYTLDTISKLFGHTTAKLVRDVYADVEGDELAQLTARERAMFRIGTGNPETPTSSGESPQT
jgi:integrase